MLYLASTRRPQNISLDDKNDTISAVNYLRGHNRPNQSFRKFGKNFSPRGLSRDVLAIIYAS